MTNPLLWCITCCLTTTLLHAQVDSGKISKLGNEMHYRVGDGRTLVYTLPQKFDFIRSLPKDAAVIGAAPFKKESLPALAAITGSTIGLFFVDQAIIDGVTQFSRNIGLTAEEKNKNVLNFKLGSQQVSLLRLPANLNTAFYQLGQGFPSLMIGLGLFTYGKMKDDYRALSTASQLAEAFILMGAGTQIVKRITGRQSPSESNTNGGNWHFFPSFAQYQQHTPNYDAFPSGHLATLMSSITIFSENYPEKKWIKPVGYTLSSLVAYSMINNKVHWVSDYPLAIGMGYLCAQTVAKRNRKVITGKPAKKNRGELNYTFNYTNGAFVPGVRYTF